MVRNRKYRSSSHSFAIPAILAAVGFAFILPIAAQAATKVIAIQVYANPASSGGSVRYGVAPENEAVSVNPGGRVRLTLVGTALIDGDGEEVSMNATFSVAAGDGVQIVGRGGNWVDVSIDRNASGVAGQIGYRLSGNYEMRGNLTNGRITLQVPRGSGGGGDHSGGNSGGGSSSRHQKAETVTKALIEGITNSTFDEDRDSEWVDEVYEGGYDSVISVANDLALSVARRRGSLDAEETVRRLYRYLLRRSSDKIDSDDGFWNNVAEMKKSGLRAVVETIVGSDEFSRAFRLDDFEAR